MFVLDGGRYSAFDPPDGISANEFVDLNDRGQVAGTYVDADTGASHGFLREKRGRFTRFDAPGAIDTYVAEINDRGQIVGTACDSEPCTQYGFLRDARRFATIRKPGAVATQAFGLDDRGRIAGDYLDKGGKYHGYLWANRKFTTIDVRGAAGTTLMGVNDRGDTVGLYFESDGSIHAFFRDARGRVTTIDAPDAKLTFPADINDRGQIAGFTTDALPLPTATNIQGFVLRNGPTGPVTRIDYPGASRTIVFGLNDHGSITGVYENPTPAGGAPPKEDR
ncbi:hypothetical protein E0H75_33060 [Kribbella capetownensis]|uniref:Uncharacterized protein n=1 Tax=Kribbella capetownensis TaxID=1572659 RepID=A0A4R0JC70_9ACTN|nr:hypothetical protein E0H75_33060 [Kribbella capetownensis]